MDHILRLLLILFICQIVKSIPSCQPNQVKRRDKSGYHICCYTVICRQGQTFAFCDHDQGHDTCRNCPENTYHLDIINTSIMTTELDPCIPKPTCEQPEVKLENGKCICDRSLGYFGKDINNCMLAETMCSSPGYELKNDGKCEACAGDFFKPEASAEHICRRKSSCHESQEIANNGSTTTDRSCKARIKIPAIKLTTENENNNNNINNNQSTFEQENYEVVIGICIGSGLVIIVCIVIVKNTHGKKSLRIFFCARNWSINCNIYEKASKDIDTNKRYNEVCRLSNESISNTYEEACVLIPSSTGLNGKKNTPDKFHDDNTNGNEIQGSIPKLETEKLHLAEIHRSPCVESYLKCSNSSTDSTSSVIVTNDGLLDFNSSSSSNGSSKAQHKLKTLNATQKLKSLPRHRHEKKLISDENKINAEFSETISVESSTAERNKLLTKQNCVLIYPCAESSDETQVDKAIEGENVCREKTYMMSTKTEEKSRPKRKTVDNLKNSDKKENSKYENIPHKIVKSTMRQLDNTNDARSFRNKQTKMFSKIDKNIQSTVNGPPNILEDESIPDPYTRRRIDFLRHVHDAGIDDLGQSNQEGDKRSSHSLRVKNHQQKTNIKDPATNVRSSVATVKPRIRRKEKDPNNQWTTREQHLAVTHPENQDGLRKVATSIAPRPSESEILNNIHSESSANTSQEERSDDTESSQSSEPSTYDPSDETVLKYLPPVDSVDFHST